MNVSGVKIADMPDMWPHIAHHFKTFEELARGEITAGEILHQVLEGRRQCWIAHEGEDILACVLTEVVGNGTKAVQIVFAAGHDRHEWRDAVLAEVEAWAAHIGATRVRIIGRKGWARETPGYGEAARVLEKEL